MLENIISAIGQSYETSRTIYNIFGSVLGIMTMYKTVYFLIGLFFTRKFKPAKNKHKYGILIAARNEEAVIGNLLDSINKQDYPKELIDVFVVADNCDDIQQKLQEVMEQNVMKDLTMNIKQKVLLYNSYLKT